MRQLKQIFCLILLATAGPTLAQTDINSIKSDPRYICAEGEGLTKRDAQNDALTSI